MCWQYLCINCIVLDINNVWPFIKWQTIIKPNIDLSLSGDDGAVFNAGIISNYHFEIDGLVQDCSISGALAMEVLQSSHRNKVENSVRHVAAILA